MKILFDQGTPVPLRNHIRDHIVDTAFERGWSLLKNGALLEEAERAGYALMITTDQNLKHQQSLAGRSLAVLVLLSTSWPRIGQRIDDINAAISSIGPGEYVEVPV